MAEKRRNGGQTSLVRVMACYAKHNVIQSEIPRARVQESTGKAATVSADIIKLGLEEGYFETPSPKGPLQVAFPVKDHEFYFPHLFLDLPVELTAEWSE